MPKCPVSQATDSQGAKSSSTTAGHSALPDRETVLIRGFRHLTHASIGIIAIAMAGWILIELGTQLWGVILPVVIGILLGTVLWPPSRFLQRRLNFPAALAATVTLLLFFAVIGAVVAAVLPPVIEQSPVLAYHASAGIETVREWISGPPFNVHDEQLNNLAATLISKLQASGTRIASGVLTGVTTIGSLMITAVMSLVIAFFLIMDGPRLLPWMRGILGNRAGGHITELGARIWKTISHFIRTQAIVSFIDAVGIGIGLVIFQVPLALPLAVITFLGGFVPIVGAFVVGSLAVLVTLVTKGFTTALIIFVIVVAVLNLEGNVLQPIIAGRTMNLHPVVVLLAVTAGGSLYGITGAFLSVPIAASLAVVLRYVSEEIDKRTGTTASEHSPSA